MLISKRQYNYVCIIYFYFYVFFYYKTVILTYLFYIAMYFCRYDHIQAYLIISLLNYPVISI